MTRAARTLGAILTASQGGAWNGIIDDAVLAAARQHDVGPLVFHALRQGPAWDRQTIAVRDALARLASEAALVDALRLDTDRSVIATLAAAGLAPLIFKGATLAHRHYPASWLRPRVDTDLLIREHDQADAAAAFERMGFTRVPRPTGDHVTHQFTYARAIHGVWAEFDVHWKIADPQVFADVLSYDDLAHESGPLPALGPAARSISDVHALLVACTHRVAHHYDSDSLLFLYDIDRLSRAFDDRSWDRFVVLALAQRVARVCARGLTLAMEVFGSPAPLQVLDALAAPGSSEPSAAYLRGRLRRVDILRSDLESLRDWRARAKLLREHLLPAPAYILHSYGGAHRYLLPVLYLHRIVHGAFEWFRPLR
ncbi:MAG: hypothetical protein AUF76_13535 [Acidobacteria bacterium 13_1_20CM_2_65_9]|nr:MAG: hypothetical protein AUF76_13535 [Acidobacteria bacterium 13_1_20CM_2_65_9]